ncbi:MAG TPA: gliding motility-associated C-terminal domain-containing protein [Flavilitoribacter sp.]|nr:gliding motility-associated C-terminal domain-containing protein [Flavilitoribacter sp.]
MMNKSFRLIVLLGILAVSAHAQTFRNIQVSGEIGPPNPEKMDCNDAGTIHFGAFNGQSNDIQPDTIFLCFGDQLPIIHNGDASLMGDPNPNTPPGVGYAVYDCKPTITGPNLATILTDGCLNHTSPLVLPDGTMIPQTLGMWVISQNANGNITLVNNGQVQTSFNNGNLVPTTLWLAPITIDVFSTQGYENDGMGGPSGPCVDVSTAESFAVVYLTPINATDQAVTASPTGCEGTFRVTGGLPEWSSLEEYSVDISLSTNPDIKGTVTSSTPNHNDMVVFSVPQPGVYNITVSDGTSCDFTFSMDMGSCQAVTFVFPLENVSPGQQECLDITVKDFDRVSTMQFTIEWDPTVIDFIDIQNANLALGNLTGLYTEVSPGMLTFSWTDPNLGPNGVTLPDGTVLFQLCFNVIGQLGDVSPIAMTGNITPIEVGDPSTPEPFSYGVVVEGGKVIVSDQVLFFLVEQDSLSCPDAIDGSFTVTLADGTAPYQFQWNTVPPTLPNQGPFVIGASGGSMTIGGLQPGNYQITVTDMANPQNMAVDTIEVLSAPEIGVDLVPTSPRCNGESNGRVEAQVLLAGVMQTDLSPFTFKWNNPTVTGAVQDNIPSGFYGVTVTDANGCSASASTTLSQPAVLNVLAQNTFITEASCVGAGDGAITISASGGTPANGAYTFTWGGGLGTVTANSATVSALEPGEYPVTVSDSRGCEFMDSYTVAAQKVLTINASVTDVSCNGGTDGAILAVGNTAGAPADLPYTFVWNNSTTPPVNDNVSSNLTDLPAGVYIVTMTDADAAGCQIMDTITVNQPEPLAASIFEQSNETCAVGNDGSVTIAVTGGTEPYNYAWSHDPNLNDPAAAGLSAGMYTVNITDANNCTTSQDVEILAPVPPAITQLDDDSVSCPEDTDGTLTVVATATSAPIVGYNWNTGDQTSTISNLAPGEYIVTVTAENACVTIDTALVLAPLPLALDSVRITSPECPGQGNGQIALFISGGTPPYQYTWSTMPNQPGTFNPLPGLFAGTYSVIVRDANNCTPLIINDLVVSDPPGIVIDLQSLTGVSCPDDTTCDGQATATAIYSDGTTANFNYDWSTGESEVGVPSSAVNQLCRGMQTVTVSDGVCGEIMEFEVASPQDIIISATTENVTCFGLTDGTVSLSATGGTAPYNYQWAGGPTGPTRNDLGAGSYDVVLTDDNGCNRQQTVQIAQPEEFIVTIDQAETTPTVSCAGDNDGVIVVVESGGNGLGANPFNWSNGVAPANSPIAANLPAGTYAVTVTDIKGCEDEVSYTINEPAPIVVVLGEPVPPICFGDPGLITIDTIYGGAGMAFLDYSYSVDNNGLFLPANQPATVFGQSHIITVEDPAGCHQDASIDIPQPAEIIIAMDDSRVVELGDSTTVNPVVSPFGTYTYDWTPEDYILNGVMSQDITIKPFSSQEYTLTVTNPDGCTATAKIFIELDANRNVYIPNGFHPDGDGDFNDEFRVFACTGVQSINYCRIYDRWGGMVYQQTEIPPVCEGGSKLWDGTINGKRANEGVYVYLIEVTFLDGVTLVYRGDVTLLW